MTVLNMPDKDYPAIDAPIIGTFNVQRFKQFCPEDLANWYVVSEENGKRPYAMYPTMGRQHVTYLGVNRLIFGSEPRAVFHSINYWYAVVGDTIYRIDRFYNAVDITGGKFLTTSGNVYFDYLVAGSITFVCFTDTQKIYIYREDTGEFEVVTDPNAPGNSTVDGIQTKPGFIAAFGNRIVVSIANSAWFYLSAINLDGSSFDPFTCFTIAGQAVFAQEDGLVRQMGVLNNTLYIFTDFQTGIWANIPTVFSGTGVTFPWKKNTTYAWNYGMADPLSLSIGFDRMCFLGRNADGLLQIMSSTGGEPTRISSKAVNTLLQRYANMSGSGPFLAGFSDGFLYQYEDTIFYRISAGKFNDYGLLDITDSANSLEYNFESDEWHRCIESNGERCRVQKHVFFNNKHFVTLSGESTIYNFGGQYYTNEIRNPLQPDPQKIDAYTILPMRYERITPIISLKDLGEFITDYLEIDFAFGLGNITKYEAPFDNTVFIIDEEAAEDGTPQFLVTNDTPQAFIVAEEGNTPDLNATWYQNLFKPSVMLYFSDDGGVTYNTADNLEFSVSGQYIWRMRWYQLGASRNRAYKLVCVSPTPMVVLGATMLVRRSSGGGN